MLLLNMDGTVGLFQVADEGHSMLEQPFCMCLDQFCYRFVTAHLGQVVV